jgi:tRNA U55 pseudouridine synthase TruB
VGGYLHGLRRVASGAFHAEACYTVRALESATSIEECLEPLDRAVLEFPAAMLQTIDVQRVEHGLPILSERDGWPGTPLWNRGTLLALGEAQGRQIKPVRVFTGARQ